MLEQVKFIYLKSPPLPADKMIPTVGLNGTHMLHTRYIYILVAKVELPTSKLIFWDLGGQVTLRTVSKHSHTYLIIEDMGKILRRSTSHYIRC